MLRLRAVGELRVRRPQERDRAREVPAQPAAVRDGLVDERERRGRHAARADAVRARVHFAEGEGDAADHLVAATELAAVHHGDRRSHSEVGPCWDTIDVGYLKNRKTMIKKGNSEAS